MATIYAYSSNNITCTYTMSLARSGTTVTLTVSGTIKGNGSSSDSTSGAALYAQVRTGVSPTNTSGTTTYVSDYGTLLSWSSTTTVTGYTGTNSNCMIASNTTSNNLPPLNATGFPTSGRSFTITYTTTNGAAVSLDDVALFIFKSKTSTTAPSNGAYSFIGKKSSSLSGNKIRYVTQDLSVAANTYTVSYNKGSNGTGTNTTATKTHGVALTLKGATFTRSGYYQSGWATSDGGSQAYALSASYTANADVTLYPVWTAYKVTVTYHINGGTITTDTTATTQYRVSNNLVQRSTDSGSTWSNYTQSISTGTDFLNPINVATFGGTKAGYYITHETAYRVGSTSGTIINENTTSASSTNPCTIATLTGSSSALTSNVSVVLYVNWSPYTLTIKYHVNEGTITTGTGTTRYRVGSDNIVERSTDSGSTWSDYTSSISTGTAYVNLVNVSTYGATRNGYGITGTTAYRAGSTSGTVINQDTSSASDTNAATIANLTGSATLTANTTVTLYINWTAYKLTVQYNANGGTINTGTGTTRYRVSSNLVQTSSDSGSTWSTLTLSSTLQTNWNLHNVTGSSYDGGVKRTGYDVIQYAEFNTKADGSGNDINMENGDTNPATIYRMNGNAYLTADKTITLYVNWVANTYTVTFNPNGGNVSTTSTTVTYASTYGTLPTPTRLGYQFDGWYTTASGGAKITSSTVVSITADQTLYALWTVQSYTITFDADGGTCSESTRSVNYGTQISNLPIPTKSGYTFKGWGFDCDGATGYAFGKDYKFTNLLSVHLDAYTSDWSLYYSTPMMLISCTQTGGWNIQTSNDGNGYIQYLCYDTDAAAYQRATSSVLWSSLSSGWHSFDLVFNGTNITGYLDGELIATSSNFTGSTIGYNDNNGIFVGAEAASTETTPTTPYFTGEIVNVSIRNVGTRLSSDFDKYFSMTPSDITLIAMWEQITDIVKAYVNGSWQTYPLKVYINGEWVKQTKIKVYDGSSWNLVT